MSSPRNTDSRSSVDHKAKASSQPKTPRSATVRFMLTTNKLYRTPPTPPPQLLREKERSFVLDCVPMSQISDDYSKANPKFGNVVPPYQGYNDKLTVRYFKFHGVNKVLQKNFTRYTYNDPDGLCSNAGPQFDRFYIKGAGFKYISNRNKTGSGHSAQQVDGHHRTEPVKPIFGYNGPFGYRRNTSNLRVNSSSFGEVTRTPLHSEY